MLKSLNGHKKTVTDVVLSPDGKIAASASYDSTVRLWSVPEGEELAVLKGHKKNVGSVAFSRDGEYLASAGLGEEIIIWSIPSGEQIQQLQGHQVAVGGLTFSPDGQFLASSGSEQAVLLWSTQDWQIARRFDFDGEPGYPKSIAFSPDWKTMAASSPYQVKLISVEKGNLLKEVNLKVKGVYALTFSPDGRWLANAAADKRVRVWDLSTKT